MSVWVGMLCSVHGGSKTEVRLVSLICRGMSISFQPGTAEYRRRRGAFVNRGVGPVSTLRVWRGRRRRRLSAVKLEEVGLAVAV
jgi:hypothetical protein